MTRAGKTADAEIVAVSRQGCADLVACLREAVSQETGGVGEVMHSITQEPVLRKSCLLAEAGIVRLMQTVEPWEAEVACAAQDLRAAGEPAGERRTPEEAPTLGGSSAKLIPTPEPCAAPVAGRDVPEALSLTIKHALSSELVMQVQVRPSKKIMCLHEAILDETANGAVALTILFESRVLDPQITVAEAGLQDGDTVFLMWSSLRCLTASGDGTLRLWQSLSGDRQEPMLLEPAGPVLVHALSPCRTRLLTMASDGEGEIWCIETGVRLCLLDGLALTGEFSLDGRWIVGISDDDTVRVWCARTGSCKRVLKGHLDDVNSASFSPDGCKIVTASSDSVACIWAVDAGRCIHSLVGHTDTVKSAAFSHDGRRVVTASMDTTARVWSVDTGQCLHMLEGHTNAVSRAAFSPTMDQVVTASFDHTVKVWKPESGECLFTLPALDMATYSPDGCMLLVSSGSEDLRLFDTSSGKLLITLSGHEDWVRAASFSSDGMLIASASYDGTMRIWSTAIGKCLQTTRVHPGAVFAAEITN